MSDIADRLRRLADSLTDGPYHNAESLRDLAMRIDIESATEQEALMTSLKIDWDHVYLLSWYDENGEVYLTTGSGNRMIVKVWITGFRGGVPLWDAPIPEGCEIHEEEVSGSVCAFGWYFEEGIERGQDGRSGTDNRAQDSEMIRQSVQNAQV